MLKRFTLSLTLLSLASTLLSFRAYATPETAEDWGLKAGQLYTETVALIGTLHAGKSTDLETEYVNGLAGFSVIAGRLAIWADTYGGASDFGCIYRGMAEEGERQLEALETASSSQDALSALERISTMLDDAQAIAAASAHAARTGDSSNGASAGHCPANITELNQYLTEQP